MAASFKLFELMRGSVICPECLALYLEEVNKTSFKDIEEFKSIREICDIGGYPMQWGNGFVMLCAKHAQCPDHQNMYIHFDEIYLFISVEE
jgi:hypothetical protein